MIGVPSDDTSSFVSPLYEYFFNADKLAGSTDQYLRYLEALRAIRSAVRAYKPAETPTLMTFVECIDLHRSIGAGITSTRQASGDPDAVQLMTAHKSKGLEFGSVYVIDAIDTVWGERARSRNRMIGYPENLPLVPAGDSADERLRLFYVAMTRAKHNLTVSYSNSDDGGKSTNKASFIVDSKTTPILHTQLTQPENMLAQARTQWYSPLVIDTPGGDLKSLVEPILASYKLSVTHLTNFLDVTRGGPQTFLLHNLLRFPQAMSPASAYGSAVHATLQRAHLYVSSKGEKQPIEDILQVFEAQLATQNLSDKDFDYYSQKGSDELHAFLAAMYDSFTQTQKVEQNFSSQHAMVGTAHLSGALDVIDISGDKTVTVTDYKTGKPALSWTGKTDYEKIKLHKYRQQLLFYKLLVEHARDYRGHTVDQGILQFVQPTSAGEIVTLTTSFADADLEQFKKLIQAVWTRIIDLDLPDTSTYDQSIKGILAFEQDLIDNTI
jgi:DNA helicase-2/ATP-dependent DNA helicase PcrA